MDLLGNLLSFLSLMMEYGTLIVIYGECTSEFLSISNIVEYQLPLSTHFAMHTPLMMYVMIVGAYTIAATDAAIPAPKTMYTVDVASYHNIV